MYTGWGKAIIDHVYYDQYWWMLLAAGVLALALAIWIWARPARSSGFLSLAIVVLIGGFYYFAWLEKGGPNAGYDEASIVSDLTSRDQTIDALRRRIADANRKLTAANRNLAAMRDDAAESTAQSRTLMRQHGERLDNLFRLAVAADPEKAQRNIEPRRRDYTQRLNERRYRDVGEQIDTLGRALERAQNVVVQSPELDDPEPVNATLITVQPREDLRELRELRELRDRMERGYLNQAYEIEPLGDAQLFEGRRGRYYVIDLRDARTGARIQFQGGQYVIEDSIRAFRWAFGIFAADVLDRLGENQPVEMFVRGSADRTTYSGGLQPGHEYRRVRYLPRIGRGRYLNSPRIHRVNDRLDNDDLPFLRAEFLKRTIQQVLPGSEPTVLQGMVTNRRNETDRAAELILFVGW